MQFRVTPDQEKVCDFFQDRYPEENEPLELFLSLK
jgi:hypothetical protein